MFNFDRIQGYYEFLTGIYLSLYSGEDVKLINLSKLRHEILPMYDLFIK